VGSLGEIIPLLTEKKPESLCVYLRIFFARAAVGWGSPVSALGFSRVAFLKTLLTLLTLLFISAEIQ